VIPRRTDETGPDDYDRDLYPERAVIEQTMNRLKRWRGVATRY
jgi:transposase